MDIKLIGFIIISFTLSLFFALFLTPRVEKFALKNKFVDYTDHRKQNINKKVRVGGIAIFISYFLSVLITSYFLFNFSDFEIDILKITKLILVPFLFFSLGLIDDLKNIKPWPKLFFQLIFSLFLWVIGFRIENLFFILNSDYLYFSLPKLLSIFFTIIWATGITNSINWIDGVDGLAIGTVGISFIPIFTINFINQNIEETIISIAIIASCISFLRYNFYPSSLLMGDCGSYLLGINLALFSMNLGFNNGLDIKNLTLINSYIPFLLTLIPLFDMARVIFLRILNKKSPFFPDRLHFHFILVDKGFKVYQSVLIIYVLNFLISLVLLTYQKVSFPTSLKVFSLVFLVTFLSIKVPKIKQNKNK